MDRPSESPHGGETPPPGEGPDVLRPRAGVNRRAALRLGLLAALAIGVLGSLKLTPLGDLLTEQGLASLLDSLGPAAIPAFVVLYGVTLALWVPGTVMTFVGAALFSPWVAVGANYCGAVLGAVLGFLVARVVGGDALDTLFAGKSELFDRYTRLIRERGFEGVLYFRMVPTPYTALSYLAGLSPIGLGKYTLATALGIFPGSIAFTFLFSTVIEGLKQGEWSVLYGPRMLTAIALFFVVGMTPRLARHARDEWGWFGGPVDDIESEGREGPNRSIERPGPIRARRSLTAARSALISFVPPRLSTRLGRSTTRWTTRDEGGAMIVQCPACSKRYRVREEKIPSGGGNIKCPSCDSVFFISPEDAVDETGAEPSGSQPAAASTDTIRAFDLREKLPEKDFDSSPSNASASTVGLTGAAATDAAAGAAAASPSSASTATGSRAGKAVKWKLRNVVGLVYDFPDEDALKQWLASRESIDGLDVSNDGGMTWRSVQDVPELLTEAGGARRRGTARMTAVDASQPSLRRAKTEPPPSEPALQAARPARKTGPLADEIRAQAEARLRRTRAQRAEPGDSEEAQEERPREFRRIHVEETPRNVDRMLALIAILVLVPMALVALDLNGIIDISEFLGRDGQEPATAAATASADDEDDEQDEAATDEPPAPAVARGGAAAQSEPQIVVDNSESGDVTSQLIAAGDEARRRGEYATAIRHYERARNLARSKPEIHCGLAGLYRRVNRMEESRASQEACAELRERQEEQRRREAAAAAPEDEPTADEGTSQGVSTTDGGGEEPPTP